MTKRTLSRSGGGGAKGGAMTAARLAEMAKDCPLFMDCTDEPLNDAQKAANSMANKAFKEQMAKLEAMVKSGGVVSEVDGGRGYRIRVTETQTLSGGSTTTTTAGGGVASTTTIPLRNGQPAGSNIRLLMDPKTGGVVGSIPYNSGGRPGGPVGPSLSAPPTAKQPRMNYQQNSVNRRGSGAEPPAPPAPVKRPPHPCLKISPKPLKTESNLQAKRSQLDSKVKQMLVKPASQFTEWLMQQGLVSAEQYDQESGEKLKLGMVSDPKRFPNTGGYVWIKGSGAGQKFLSALRGSIFEGKPPLTPVNILKLMYHWSCQTAIPNIAAWVKVDNNTVDSYFQLFRSVCVGTVQEEVTNFGGQGKAVEIGVISLGTTSAGSGKREVRVEILGVLDRSTGQVRLRATDPFPPYQQAKRFEKIFQVLPTLLQRGTKIVTDFSIDRNTLFKMGFADVVQTTAAAKRPEGNNAKVMDYLKRVVPKMFQDSLSFLTTPEIQVFLDELTFRESFGHYPLLCFDSMINRCAAQTSASQERSMTFIKRATDIIAEPFNDWRITRPSVRNQPNQSQSNSNLLPVQSKSNGRPMATSSPIETNIGMFNNNNNNFSKGGKVHEEVTID